jgi:hydroxylysine kinase
MPLQRMHQLFAESGLTSRHTPLSGEIVLSALRDHYGLDGTLHPIDTEKDSTFRLRRSDPSASDMLVKVSPPDEPLQVVRCQTDVIDWMQQVAPDIPVQTVQRTLRGQNHHVMHDESGQLLGVLRVLEFIPGTMLGDAEATPEQLRKVGAMLARVDLALQDFDHPGIERPLVWDIGRFMLLEPLLEYEPSAERRRMAEQAFDLYRTELEPVRAQLRSQVIHGDFSAFNAVVDPEDEAFVTGVIDFGDVQRGPVIFDPAVLFANHLRPAPDHPWQTARDMLTGYLDVHPLDDEEIRLLAIASLARVVLRALVTNWRTVQVPERAEYLRMHAREDWQRIENTLDWGIEAGVEYLRTARDNSRPKLTEHTSL